MGEREKDIREGAGREGAVKEEINPLHPPETEDEILDETYPGGAYFINDVPVNADGELLEAPPDPPADADPNATAEQKAERLRERAKWEQDKLRWEENKKRREEWEKNKKEEREKRAKATQLPAEPRRGPGRPPNPK